MVLISAPLEIINNCSRVGVGLELRVKGIQRMQRIVRILVAEDHEL